MFLIANYIYHHACEFNRKTFININKMADVSDCWYRARVSLYFLYITVIIEQTVILYMHTCACSYY